MATALTPVRLSRSALTALAVPAAGNVAGNIFPNGGATFLHVKNTGATPRTLEVKLARTVDGQAVTSRSIPVAANAEGFYLVGAPADYGQVVTVVPSHADVAITVYQL